MKRDFWLVQSFEAPHGESDPVTTQAGYRASYMGAAEYEFGALQSCFKAMRDAESLSVGEVVIDGQQVSYLYVTADGDPADDMLRWYEGSTSTGRRRKCPCKISSYFEDVIEARVNGTERASYVRAVAWWAIGDSGQDNVIFGLSDEPHFANLVGWINNRREATGKDLVVA